jgi:hypothetical protein
MNLKPILNKTSPHMELELDVLGVAIKLVKYVVYFSKRIKFFFFNLSSHKLPKLQSTSFWSQGILWVNP